jgi:SAM-dependent methyltransferase
MVEHCRSQGLAAYQQDVLHLDLPRSFDAAFAMNCLLHVPAEDMPDALRSVRSTLEPGGLFFLGQYGGTEHAGEFPDDEYEPKRFFSWLTDDQMRAVVSDHFDVLSFTTVDLGSTDGTHFQSFVLRA